MSESGEMPKESKQLALFREAMGDPYSRLLLYSELFPLAVTALKTEDEVERRNAEQTLDDLKTVTREHYKGELVIPETDEQIGQLIADCNVMIEGMNKSQADNMYELQAEAMHWMMDFWPKWVRFSGAPTGL